MPSRCTGPATVPILTSQIKNFTIHRELGSVFRIINMDQMLFCPTWKTKSKTQSIKLLTSKVIASLGVGMGEFKYIYRNTKRSSQKDTIFNVYHLVTWHVKGGGYNIHNEKNQNIPRSDKDVRISCILSVMISWQKHCASYFNDTPHF